MPSKSDPLESFVEKVEDDCDRPACEDTVTALSQALNRLRKVTDKNADAGSIRSCPPKKDAIGKSSWTLLHSMVRHEYIVSISHFILADELYSIWTAGSMVSPEVSETTQDSLLYFWWTDF